MKRILSQLFTIVLILILCSCNKGNITKVHSTGIYSVGESMGGLPIYWLDTVQHELPHLGYGGVASAIYIDDLGDVYIAGKINYITNSGKSISHACYWKNGVLTDLGLSDPEKYSFATDIVVQARKVYVSGVAQVNNADAASYWVDGKRKILNRPAQITDGYKAVSIAVLNGKIYIANDKLGYWIDEIFSLLDGVDIQLDDLCISNNKVVISGQAASKAAIWVDGQRTELNNATNRGHSFAVGTCMNKNDTWAAVLIYQSNRSVILKNGQIYKDVSPPGGLNTVIVTLTLWNDNIYACGTSRFIMSGGVTRYQAFIFHDNHYKVLQGLDAFIYDMAIKES